MIVGETLSEREVQLLYCSLWACCRSGGGSETYTLMRKLSRSFQEALDDQDKLLDLVQKQAKVCIDEWLESTGLEEIPITLTLE